MNKWIDMGIGCDNCGFPLEARPAIERHSMTIHGYEPMEWRHTDGTTECVIRRKPRPYSDANQYRRYQALASSAKEQQSCETCGGSGGIDAGDQGDVYRCLDCSPPTAEQEPKPIYCGCANDMCTARHKPAGML